MGLALDLTDLVGQVGVDGHHLLGRVDVFLPGGGQTHGGGTAVENGRAQLPFHLTDDLT